MKKKLKNLNYKKIIKKKLPILTCLQQYSIKIFFQDILAGLTVGLTEIPQSVAYASLAGLPPEYGLYSGLADGFIYAIFGTCKDINIGPTSIIPLLIIPTAVELGPEGVILITLITGIVIILCAILQLGFLINFFSYPVSAGFICAGCLQIFSSQLIKLLGISASSSSFLDSWRIIFGKIHETTKEDCLLGVVSIIFLLAFKEIQRCAKSKLFKKIFFALSLIRNIAILIFGTFLSYYLETPFKVTGDVKGGFPTFELPQFTMDIFHNVSVFIIPFLSILEELTMAKIFKKGEKLDANQEMLALGLCNFIGSFLGSMPVTGCFSRSVVNNAAGVKTTIAGCFTSILLLLTIAFLTPTFYYIPKTTLAAILIAAVFYIFDYRAFSLFWKKKLDAVPFLITLVGGLFVGLDYAILMGVAINLSFVLFGSAHPQISLTKRDFEKVAVFTPNDTLYFPAVEYLRNQVLHVQSDVIVINGKFIKTTDVTVAKGLANLVNELLRRNQNVLLVNFKKPIVDICIKIEKGLVAHFKNNEEEYTD